MAKVFFAAALLSGVLAVSGCAGLVPGLEGLGSAGGGYPAYGGAQAYPYNPGMGGGYAQPVQPYYQPQAYAYSGAPEAYAYQPDQPFPQATQEYEGAPPGRWQDRRQRRHQDQIDQGRAPGHWSQREARRWQNEPGGNRGSEGRMSPGGNLGPQERGRPNGMHNRGSQEINRQRHYGVQPGPAVQSRPAGPGRPTAQLHSGVQPRAAAQPRANGGRPGRHGGSAR